MSSCIVAQLHNEVNSNLLHFNSAVYAPVEVILVVNCPHNHHAHNAIVKSGVMRGKSGSNHRVSIVVSFILCISSFLRFCFKIEAWEFVGESDAG
jgi:hypothetical protein